MKVEVSCFRCLDLNTFEIDDLTSAGERLCKTCLMAILWFWKDEEGKKALSFGDVENA